MLSVVVLWSPFLSVLGVGYCGGSGDVVVVLWALATLYRYGICCKYWCIVDPGDPVSPWFLQLVLVLPTCYPLIQGLCLTEGVRDI